MEPAEQRARGGRGEEAAAAAAGGGGGKGRKGEGREREALREATSPGHTSSFARRTEDPVPEPRQPSQPGAVLGQLAAPERAAGDRASPPAPSC